MTRGKDVAVTPSFHLFLPQMRMSHDAIVERALAAESAGFDGIAFMDHLAPPLAFATFLFFYLTLAAAGLNVAALRLLRRA